MFLFGGIFMIISFLVQLYILIIIIQVGMSWLIAFELVNEENEAARNLTNLLKKLTDPVYKPVRKYVPPIGGIDLTPLVVIIGIQFLMWFLFTLMY